MPNLDSLASAYFRYRALIQCGETFARVTAALEPAARDRVNLPLEEESWGALAELATTLLDPLVERFGAVTLTYVFAGPWLARRVPGRVAPSLDQHASFERTRTGRRVCERGGAAADLCVADVDARTLARFITTTLPFDRLYFYGEDRPLHVSVGPQKSRTVYALLVGKSGQRFPRVWRP